MLMSPVPELISLPSLSLSLSLFQSLPDLTPRSASAKHDEALSAYPFFMQPKRKSKNMLQRDLDTETSV